MATFRLEAKVISRAKGRSATASAAYRSGAAIEDERTGQIFDYTRMRGVRHSEIIAPENTPDWMLNRSTLWNTVERIEQRRDAQLARDFVLSLPHELTHDQRVELVREFIGQEFVSRGMIADFSIHAPDRRGDTRNHHAHVMVTMRELTGSGFGLKNRDWNKTALLEEWRERWADTLNRHLERQGHEARVDHRSLNDQGIDREPEPKQGPVATEMELNGRASHAGDDRRAVKARNEEREALARVAGELGAELIMLDPDRPRSPAFDDVREGLEKKPGKRRSHSRFADTDGGMVAQQAGAMQRFRRNSEALKARRSRASRSDTQTPSGLDDARNPSIVSHATSESRPMTSRFDRIRTEQSKSTEGKEQTPPQRGPDTDRADPMAAQERVSNLNWSMDQSMPAQNAAANRWAQESQARRQAESRDEEAGKTKEQANPDRDPDAQPNRDDPGRDDSGAEAKDKNQGDKELSFRRDVSPVQRADLKREQSEQNIDSKKKDAQELSFRRNRGGPDLDR